MQFAPSTIMMRTARSTRWSPMRMKIQLSLPEILWPIPAPVASAQPSRTSRSTWTNQTSRGLVRNVDSKVWSLKAWELSAFRHLGSQSLARKYGIIILSRQRRNAGGLASSRYSHLTTGHLPCVRSTSAYSVMRIILGLCSSNSRLGLGEDLVSSLRSSDLVTKSSRSIIRLARSDLFWWSKRSEFSTTWWVVSEVYATSLLLWVEKYRRFPNHMK